MTAAVMRGAASATFATGIHDMITMSNHLRDFVKKRFKVGLDALPEREHRVVQHFGDRLPISHDTNLEFEKKLTFGQRLADYDLAGNLTSESYPSGRVVKTAYDQAGRISSLSGVKDSTTKTYASQFYYAAHGAVAKLMLGNKLGILSSCP